MTTLTFSVPPAALDFWPARLEAAGVDVRRFQRLGEEALALVDPDGIPLEVGAVAEDAGPGWAGAEITAALPELRPVRRSGAGAARLAGRIRTAVTAAGSTRT